MMSKAKQKYEASRAKLKPLTPIKETSNLYTPRISEKKTVMVRKHKPIVVQTLPLEYQPKQQRIFDDSQQMQPVQDDDVEKIVQEYLHYSKYRNALPVQQESWDGRSTLTCACCQKRNMESMQLKRELAIASNTPKATLDLHDAPKLSDLEAPSPRRERNNEITSRPKNPSDRCKYEPMPYAQTYLNPEFKRPHVLQDFYENSRLDAEGTYVKLKVIDADSRYQEAMKKLERKSKYFDRDRTEHDEFM